MQACKMTTKPVEFPDAVDSDSEREDETVKSPENDERPQPILKTYKVPNDNDKSASKSSAREDASKTKSSKRVDSNSNMNSKDAKSDEKNTLPVDQSISSPARPKLAIHGHYEYDNCHTFESPISVLKTRLKFTQGNQ
jgi:hypothetical protein